MALVEHLVKEGPGKVLQEKISVMVDIFIYGMHCGFMPDKRTVNYLGDEQSLRGGYIM